MSTLRISWNFGDMTSYDVTMTQKLLFWRKILLLQILSKCHHNTYTCVLKAWQYFIFHIKVKVKGQGHFVVISGSQRNNFPGSNFYQIDFKLDGNVAYTQAHSWLVFIGNQPWPLEFLQRSKKLTPRSNFHIAGTISCSISNERYWWVLSGSVTILAIWRHMTSQWRKNCFFDAKFHFFKSCPNVTIIHTHVYWRHDNTLFFTWRSRSKVKVNLWSFQNLNETTFPGVTFIRSTSNLTGM